MQSSDGIDFEARRLVSPWRALLRLSVVPAIYLAAVVTFFSIAAGASAPPELGSSADQWLEILQSAAVAPPDIRAMVLHTGCVEHLECSMRCGDLTRQRTFTEEFRTCLRDVSQSYAGNYPRGALDDYVDIVLEALYRWR